MRMWGRCRAVVLLGGGWLLLFNADGKAPNAPLSAWKEVGSFETTSLCQQARLKEVLTRSKQEASGGVPKSNSLQPIALRYRCARVEEVRPPKPR